MLNRQHRTDRPSRHRSGRLVVLTAGVIVGAGTLVVTGPATPMAAGSTQLTPAAETIDVRTYAAVGDSITAGIPGGESTGIYNPGASSWLNGETTERLVLTGGWARSTKTTSDMLANVVPTTSDVLVLLGGTNDLNRIPWTTTESNLQGISTTIGARTTLLVAIPPIRGMGAVRNDFNAHLADLAAQQGWRFLDPWGSFDVNGEWAPGADQDGLHPTPQTAIAVGAVITDGAWRAAARRGA